MKDHKYDYLIVGSGIYGAVMARELADNGRRILVVEKRDHIGGNSYTEDVSEILVHRYGPHIFHTDSEEVWNYVNKYAEFREFVNEPRAYYRGRMYSLPFNMNTFHEMWGVTEPEEARHIIEEQIHEYFKSRGKSCEAPLSLSEGSQGSSLRYGSNPANLEEKAISLVGTDIYNVLIKGYTEKQWGRPCSELPASIISRIPVRYEYNNNYYNDRYQGIPADGYTRMIERMLDGIEVMTGTDYLAPGIRHELEALAGKVVFTGQIDAYYDYCYGPLNYRGLRFETEMLRGVSEFQDRAVVNYTDAEIPWTRIIEHSHFQERGSQDRQDTIITREYPATWTPGDEAFYPVRDAESTARYESYLGLARTEGNVFFGGRLGSYSYLDMDDAVMAALRDAEMLINDEARTK